MAKVSAAPAGRFRLGEIEITRLGFGAMRITGQGIWGEPADRAECLRTLKALPELGVDFIDTADSYGPEVSEKLICEALHPYAGMLIATKGGHERPGPGIWEINCKPERLIKQAHRSRELLGVERIDLWQLHRVDPKVPRDEQFAAIRQLIDTGVIRFAGLSEVKVDDIKAAQAVFPVVSIQNRYNLTDRKSAAELKYCEDHGIGFIPWHPLGAGNLAKDGGPFDKIARRHKATPSQIALAWTLEKSPVLLPIPGTSKVAHLEENVAAAAIQLSDEDMAALEAHGRRVARKEAFLSGGALQQNGIERYLTPSCNWRSLSMWPPSRNKHAISAPTPPSSGLSIASTRRRSASFPTRRSEAGCR